MVNRGSPHHTTRFTTPYPLSPPPTPILPRKPRHNFILPIKHYFPTESPNLKALKADDIGQFRVFYLHIKLQIYEPIDYFMFDSTKRPEIHFSLRHIFSFLMFQTRKELHSDSWVSLQSFSFPILVRSESDFSPYLSSQGDKTKKTLLEKHTFGWSFED